MLTFICISQQEDQGLQVFAFYVQEPLIMNMPNLDSNESLRVKLYLKLWFKSD